MITQPELPIRTETPLFLVKPGHPNIDWFIRMLEAADTTGDWLTAADICRLADKPVTDQNKRWVRALADASEGRVAGGQRGYKLIGRMTRDEYDHWRNWMTHQADEMRRRVIEADKVWYKKKP